jgi:hypothetical protein
MTFPAPGSPAFNALIVAFSAGLLAAARRRPFFCIVAQDVYWYERR